jgi:hypothetical protein
MRGWTCLTVLAAVTLVDLAVPYFFIGDIASIWASYLFWSLLTLAVIVFAVIHAVRWGSGA